MTRIQMTEMLSETIRVSAKEAGEALEARDWNLMEAAQLLQRRQRAKRAEVARACKSGSVVRDIIAWFRADSSGVASTTLAPLFTMRSANQFGQLC